MPLEQPKGGGYLFAIKQLIAQLESGEATGLFEPAATVSQIVTPASADAEDCANKINEILEALTDAGLMAAE